jgi:hypothetical protein
VGDGEWLRRVYGGREIHAVSMVGDFELDLGAERCLLRAHEKTGAGQHDSLIAWLALQEAALRMEKDVLL